MISPMQDPRRFLPDRTSFSGAAQGRLRFRRAAARLRHELGIEFRYINPAGYTP
jgi:hypothetical protein